MPRVHVPQFDKTVGAGILMTQPEAERFLRMLTAFKRRSESVLESIPKKRSWQPSVKAVMLAEYQQHLDDINTLQDRIRAAFNL